MARPNKIWWREDRKSWFVTIKGVRHKLGTDEDAAKKEFHRLMSLEEAPAPVQSELAVQLLDKFLVWTQSNKAPETYKWYKKHIQSFIDSLSNQRITVEALKPHHVTDWLKPSWSATYRRGAIVAIQRAFNWLTKQGYISSSPVANIEKPSAERRDNCPTQAEYEAMLALAKGNFKALMEFIYETGCRPQEACLLEASHIQGDKAVLMVKQSKGKKYKRVIYLTEKAKAIVQSLLGTKEFVQSKPLFTNRNGNPWTAFAIDCQMKRIALKTGKKFAMYDLRHFAATRWLEAGLDHMTVAKLLGHRDVTILSRVYAHIGERSDFLLEKLRQVQ